VGVFEIEGVGTGVFKTFFDPDTGERLSGFARANAARHSATETAEGRRS
jgi:hypothetical protein